MASILPGYEYDIFVSYRHNDNRSGGVTEFVEYLQEELAATIKEPLSVYFDSNGRDALLENHTVDKSLERKLKCLIFIPIVSQTYCDTTSFAWQHELVAFNKLAKEDSFGLEVKLTQGNIASRILPIKIHELDSTDQATIEKEIGGVLRAIEFIYKEPGVNRPLSISDNKKDNQNKTDYKNQINKVANAVKEIVTAMKTPIHWEPEPEDVKRQPQFHQPTQPKRRKAGIAAILVLLLSVVGYFIYPQIIPQREITTLSNSIAVLPFENMSGEDDAYFSQGVTEDILTQISKINDLRVLSRFTLKDYDSKGKTVQQIGAELGVGYLLTGSIRRAGEDLRIACQLVQVNPEQETWAENFDKRMDDVFAIQKEVATEVARYLKARLSPTLENEMAKRPTENLVAYNYYLKGRSEYYKYEPEAMKNAITYFKESLVLDPGFALAWAGLSDAYSQGVTYAFLPISFLDSAMAMGQKAVQLDPNSAEAWKALGMVYQNKGLYDEAAEKYEKSLSLNPSYEPAIGNLGIVLSIQDRNDEAIRLQKQAIRVNPLNFKSYTSLGDHYITLEMYPEAEANFKKALELNPRDWGTHYSSAYLYALGDQPHKVRQHLEGLIAIDPKDPVLNENAADVALNYDPEIARPYLLKSIQAEGFNPKSNYTVPLGIGYLLLQEGKIDSAKMWLDPALDYHLQRAKDGSEEINNTLMIASLYAVKNEKKEAMKWLRKMIDQGYLDRRNLMSDLRMANLRREPEFINMMEELEQKISAMRLKLSAQEQKEAVR